MGASFKVGGVKEGSGECLQGVGWGCRGRGCSGMKMVKGKVTQERKIREREKERQRVKESDQSYSLVCIALTGSFANANAIVVFCGQTLRSSCMTTE